MRLPGSAAAAREVANMLRQKGILTTMVSGDRATKEALLSVKRPRYLHISTHGYFFADRGEGSYGHPAKVKETPEDWLPWKYTRAIT